MTYEENVTALAERTVSAVGSLFDDYTAAQLTYAEFSVTTSTLISTAMAQGVTLAELTLGGYLEQALGYVPAFAGVAPQDAASRLATALATITASDLDTRMQLERLARSEVLDSAATGFDEAIKRNPHVDRYTRGLESNACELCVWLYKDGYPYPVTKPMHRHPGCTCHPVPVIKRKA